MGRNKTPTKLKIVRGTDRADRQVENEVEPDLNIPIPPEHLNQIASVEWGRISEQLYKLGLLSDIDRAALAGYCVSWSRWVEAEKELAKDGLTIETTNGNIIQNPVIGIANQAMTHMRKFLIEFGMSPAARTRVAGKPTEEPQSGFGKYKKKQG